MWKKEGYDGSEPTVTTVDVAEQGEEIGWL
jgi:hypothetical protein